VQGPAASLGGVPGKGMGNKVGGRVVGGWQEEKEGCLRKELVENHRHNTENENDLGVETYIVKRRTTGEFRREKNRKKRKAEEKVHARGKLLGEARANGPS